MLQRSCYFIKYVSPSTLRQDILAGVITRFFHGNFPQRQLHSLINDIVRKRHKIGGWKYSNLQILCMYQKKELISTALLSHDKTEISRIEYGKGNSKNRNSSSSNLLRSKPIQNCYRSSNDRHITSTLCYNAETASKSNNKTNVVKDSATDKNKSKSSLEDDPLKENKNKSTEIYKEELSIQTKTATDKVQNNSSNNILKKQEGEGVGNDNNKSQSNFTKIIFDKNFSSHNNSSKSNEIDKKSIPAEETMASQAAQGPDSNLSTETETAKAESETKILKGKSANILLEKAKNLLRKSPKSDEQHELNVDSGSAKAASSVTSQKKRQSFDPNKCSTERNFITPVRAMTDFLLKPSDLEGLRKTKRRSPYDNEPPITVYWRKDVEAKAIDVWGSKENLLKEILKRDIERRRYQQNIFTVKRRLRDYRREQGRETEISFGKDGLFGATGKVVLTAIFINGSNFLLKLGAWWYTGSHSMFSEALHSLADTMNQLILAYGISKSVQRADSNHPYGYTNMRYVSSLISGVAIFCLGSGLSIYHGVIGLTDPTPIKSFYWAFLILVGSLASEGATLFMAINSVRQGARSSQMNVTEYILRSNDPSVNVILLEDSAAVMGVMIAGTFMGLSSLYENPIPDAIGSLLVGGLLAGVATFIIYTNVAALVGRSIPQERLDKINAELESDVMIRAIHDVKGIDMGNSLVRYKAEMDFDGGALTRSYLDKQDLNQMLEEVKKFETIDDLEEFMLKHGENIVDMLGGEIDRIELKLRKKHPEIRHCDLEIL